MRFDEQRRRQEVLALVQRGAREQCWPWLGFLDRDGYGRVSWKGRKQYAHRLVYVLLGGAMPEGAKLLHGCDNPPCCNPWHLWKGTQLQNIEDMLRKGRHATTTGLGALTVGDTARVQDLLVTRAGSLRAIGRYFRVDCHVIARIRDGVYQPGGGR
jgi:hypothetical protein